MSLSNGRRPKMDFSKSTSQSKKNEVDLPSNMCTLASALSRMASMNMAGKNLDRMILTFGPMILSDIIFEKSSADLSRTVGFVPLQNKSRR